MAKRQNYKVIFCDISDVLTLSKSETREKLPVAEAVLMLSKLADELDYKKVFFVTGRSKFWIGKYFLPLLKKLKEQGHNLIDKSEFYCEEGNYQIDSQGKVSLAEEAKNFLKSRALLEKFTALELKKQGIRAKNETMAPNEQKLVQLRFVPENPLMIEGLHSAIKKIVFSFNSNPENKLSCLADVVRTPNGVDIVPSGVNKSLTASRISIRLINKARSRGANIRIVAKIFGDQKLRDGLMKINNKYDFNLVRSHKDFIRICRNILFRLEAPPKKRSAKKAFSLSKSASKLARRRM